MKRTFVFHQYIQYFIRNRFTSKVKKRIDQILTDFTKKVNKKGKSRKISAESCELVCVHIRRGDHLEYETLNGVAHLKKQYFLQAMDIYKENLQHPVFIIITDDTHWAFTQIHRSFKPYFTGQIYISVRSDLFSVCRVLRILQPE